MPKWCQLMCRMCYVGVMLLCVSARTNGHAQECTRACAGVYTRKLLRVSCDYIMASSGVSHTVSRVVSVHPTVRR